MKNLRRTAFFEGAAELLPEDAAFHLTKRAFNVEIPDWAGLAGLGAAGLGGGMAAGYGLHSFLNRNKDTEQPQAMQQVGEDAMRKQMLPQMEGPPMGLGMGMGGAPMGMGMDGYPPAEELLSLYAGGGQNAYELPNYAYYF